MLLKIKKLRPDAVIPARRTPCSAGLDLAACLDADVVIEQGETAMIPTGIAAAPEDENSVLLIYARSGLAARSGIIPANCVGVVDSDYRGEIMVPLANTGKAPFTVTHGMRIAQLVVAPVWLPEIMECDTLDDTRRGEGGFGSTGIL